VLLLLLLAVLVSGSAAQAASDPASCRAVLPRGPAVPAPIVFRNSCGGFLLDRDGRVARLSREWFARRSVGTGRRYGADLRLRRTRPGAFILGRKGAVVWRSSSLYRNDGGDVAFGPGAFAFASYRRGIFVTDLRGPERLVVPGRGLHPIAFLHDGSLLVSEPGRTPSILVVSPGGSLVARYRYRRMNGYAFDERMETLHLVLPSRLLVRIDATGVRVVRALRDLDGWVWLTGPYLMLSDFAHRGRSDEIRVAVLRRDGGFVSRWRWRSPTGAGVDSGPEVSPDGQRFAFRTVTRPRGEVVVYVLRDGEKQPTQVLRHAGRQAGCGVGASFSWHGRALLYTATDGPATIVDTRDGTIVSLIRIASELQRRAPGERGTAHWLSGFRRP
jgi:hypothetical protein